MTSRKNRDGGKKEGQEATTVISQHRPGLRLKFQKQSCTKPVGVRSRQEKAVGDRIIPSVRTKEHKKQTSVAQANIRYISRALSTRTQSYGQLRSWGGLHPHLATVFSSNLEKCENRLYLMVLMGSSSFSLSKKGESISNILSSGVDGSSGSSSPLLPSRSLLSTSIVSMVVSESGPGLAGSTKVEIFFFSELNTARYFFS